MMKIDKSLKRVIENAYQWLDYDKDGKVSVSDLQKSCNLHTEEEAISLLQSLKSNEFVHNDHLKFDEFYSGILEFPCLLSQFSRPNEQSSQEPSFDSINISIHEDDDINTKLCEAISVISNIVNSHHNYCKYYPIDELLEIVHELLLVMKLKNRKYAEKREITKAVIILYSIVKLQNTKYSQQRERLERKVEEYEIIIENLSRKYEDVEDRNQEYLEKIISLEKSLKRTMNELESYKKMNIELSTRCSIEDSETSARSSITKKDLEIVEHKIKKFLTLNMFIESQKKADNSFVGKHNGRSHQYSECCTDTEKNHHIDILNEQLNRKDRDIKEKEEEIRFMLDMINNMRNQIEELNEEKKNWVCTEKFIKFYEDSGYESDTSLKSMQEHLEISCIENSFRLMIGPKHSHKDSQTQTCTKDTRSRECSFWIF